MIILSTYYFALSACDTSLNESEKAVAIGLMFQDNTAPSPVISLAATVAVGQSYSPTIKESTGSASLNFAASNLVDNNQASSWALEPDSQRCYGYSVVDLGSTVEVGHIKLFKDQVFQDFFPSDYEILVSIDNNNFVPIIREYDFSTNDSEIAYSFLNQSARYVKIEITGCNKHENGYYYSVISEMKLFKSLNQSDSILLTWIAPGDDGNSGQALNYNIRYSTSSITESNFNQANELSYNAGPDEAGTFEKFEVFGLLTGEFYYFALKTEDENGNTSAISNIASIDIPGIAPSIINDLKVTDTRSNAIRLSWTAVGDDGMVGTAESYDIRYSIAPITSSNFLFVDQVANPPIPAVSMSEESYWVQGLPSGSELWFAIKAVDKSGNKSAISNVVKWKTLEGNDTTAPAGITNLSASPVNDIYVQAAISQIESSSSHEEFTEALLHDDSVESFWVSEQSEQDFEISLIIDLGNFSNVGKLKMLHSESWIAYFPPSFVLQISENNEDFITVFQQDNFKPRSGEWSTWTFEPVYGRYVKLVIDKQNNNFGKYNSIISEIELYESISDPNAVSLSWVAPGDDEQVGTVDIYDIRYSINQITEYNFTEALPVLENIIPQSAGSLEKVKISGLQGETNYYFAIKSEDESGNVSILSNITSCQTAFIVPGTVTDLAILETDSNQITIEWSATGDDGLNGIASAYEIRTLIEGELTAISWNVGQVYSHSLNPGAPGSSEMLTVTGLQSNRVYSVGIKVVDDKNNKSRLSNVVSTRTIDILVPESIPNLECEQQNMSDRLFLTWTSPESDTGRTETVKVDGYELKYSNTPITADNYESIENVINIADSKEPGVTEEYLIESLLENKQYYFAVKSKDSSSNVSGISNILACSTPNIAPSAVTDLTAEYTDAFLTELAFTVPGDDGYLRQAERLDFRMSDSIITEQNYYQAQKLQVYDEPGTPNTAQSVIVDGLSPNNSYYFALKTSDKTGNVSGISNVILVDTTEPVFNVTVLDPNNIQVDFAEQVQNERTCFIYELENPDNFLNITAINQQTSTSYIIETFDHVPDAYYIIEFPTARYMVDGLLIEPHYNFFYGYNDTTPPELLKAYSMGPDKIDLIFNEVMDHDSVTNFLNYIIEGLDVDKVLRLKEKSYRLITENQQPGTDYELIIKDVKDDWLNIINSEKNSFVISAYDESNAIKISLDSESADFSSMEDALASLDISDGSIIKIAKGVYFETFITEHYALVIKGGYDSNDWSRDLYTNETIFNLKNTASIVLKNNTILNGVTIADSNSFGLLLSGSSSILNSRIYGNKYAGIIVDYKGFNAVISNNVIFNNETAGVQVEDLFGLQLTNNTFVNNTGPAIHLNSEFNSINIVNNIIYTSKSSDLIPQYDGTGILIDTGASYPNLENNLFYQNEQNDFKWSVVEFQADGDIIHFNSIDEINVYDPVKGETSLDWKENINADPEFSNLNDLIFTVSSVSNAIDAGNSYFQHSNEPDYPNGSINIGAYGNTIYAAPDALKPGKISTLYAEPASSGNLLVDYTVSSSSGELSLVNSIDKIHDRNMSTFWVSEARSNNVGEVIVLSLGEEKDITRIKMFPAMDYRDLFPKGFTIEIWNSESGWSKIVEEVNFDIENRQTGDWSIGLVKARSIRIKITDTAYKYNNYYTAFSELEIYGAPENYDSAVLSFVAVGDDGLHGKAEKYYIRYSTSPINDGNFNEQIDFPDSPSPAEPGSLERVSISGLQSETEYYFAVKVEDELGNLSEISNIVSTITLGIPPNSVDNLKVEAAGYYSVSLSWASVLDDGVTGRASEYDIRYSTERVSYSNWEDAVQVENEPMPSDPGNEETIIIEELLPDTTYFFGIKSKDDGGNVSGLSNIVFATTIEDIKPGQISDLEADTDTSKDGVVILTFTAPGDDDFTGTVSSYEIRYSKNLITNSNFKDASVFENNYEPKIATFPETIKVDGLENETKYYFAIKAIDEAENISDISNIVFGFTRNTLPASIPDLIVTAKGTTFIKLSWSATGDDWMTGLASGYEIRYATWNITDSNFHQAIKYENSLVPLEPGTKEEIIINNLTQGKKYYFAIKVIDDLGNMSAISNTVSDETLDDVKPAAIQNLSCYTGSENGSVNLRWYAVGDDEYTGKATQYTIKYSTSGITEQNFNSATSVLNPPVPYSAGYVQLFNVRLLENETSYYFAIKTEDESGNVSDISNVVDCDTSEVKPARIVDLLKVNIGKTWIDLKWTATGDDENSGTASNYDVRYSTSLLNESNWIYANKGNGEPSPSAPGSEDQYKLTGLLEATNHYIAVKAVDDRGNSSTISNILYIKTVDTLKPSPINIVSCSAIEYISALYITWEATGDNGTEGYSDSYDIRISQNNITSQNFENAEQVNQSITPKAAGLTESFTFSDLDHETLYYIAIKATDSSGNVSNISNVINCRTREVKPYNVSNLSVGTTDYETIELKWIATGDDEDEGQASLYDLRYSKNNITEYNWSDATKILSIPKPESAGTDENYIVTNLEPNTKYYFAIKVIDDRNNISALSNVVLSSTLDPYPPAKIDSLRGIVPSKFGSQISYVVLSSSGNYSEDYTADNIKDDSIYTDWAAPVGDIQNEEYITLDLGGLKDVEIIRLHPSLDFPDFFPIDFLIFESNDNISWETVAEYYDYEVVPGEFNKFVFKDLNCRFIKIAINASHFKNGAYYTAVSELEVYSVPESPDKIRLTWTAPGDDGNVGRAKVYDIRYSKSPITIENYNNAQYVSNIPEPKEAGEVETFVIPNLSGETTYYFAMKTQDESSNISEMSNVLIVETLPVPPGKITSLQSENAMYSVVLKWNAVGDDLYTGTAASYEIRYCDKPIYESTFNSCVKIDNNIVPAAVGTAEQFTINSLETGTKYYFGIKVFDEDANASFVSNIVSATAIEPDNTAPSAIQNLSVGINSGGKVINNIEIAEYSGEQTPSYTSDKIVDSDLSSDWSTPAREVMQDEYITVNLGSLYLINEIRLYPSESFSNLFPKDFKIRISSDNTGWGEVASETGYEAESGRWGIWRFESKYAQYIKIAISTTTLSSNNLYYAIISEIKDFESSSASSSLSLQWLAPGDDENSGQATGYEIKYSTSNISSEQDWNDATVVNNELDPGPAGSYEKFSVGGLNPGTLYYFSVKTFDEENNKSEISNVVSGQVSETQMIEPVWGQFHYDMYNRGLSSNDGPMHEEPVLIWEFNVIDENDGFTYSSPSIDAYSTIYIGSNKGWLYAINNNSSLKWKYKAGTHIQSQPAISKYDGTIYITADAVDEISGSKFGKLLAVYPDGTLKWSYSLDGETSKSSPKIDAEGTIYVGCMDGAVYALNIDGTLKWKYQTSKKIESVPAIDDNGIAYFGSYNGTLYAINPNGTLKWSLHLGAAIHSSPTILENGDIYLSVMSTLTGDKPSPVYGINSNGTLKWSNNDLQSYAYASPVYHPLYAIVFLGYHGIWGYNPDDGSTKLSYSGTTCPRSKIYYNTPVVGASDYVYTASDFGEVCGIIHGYLLKFKIIDLDPIYSTPTITVNSRLIVGTSTGKVLAFE